MTNEVDVPVQLEVVQEDEADFAMKYANERKKRINAERRLMAFMYEIIPFFGASNELIECVLTMDADGSKKAMRTLVAWRSDLEINIALNWADPVTTRRFFTEEEVSRAGGFTGLPPEKLERFRDAAEAAAKEIYKQWDRFAAQHPELADRERAAQISHQQFDELVEHAMTRQRERYGKDESPKTH